MTVLESYDIDEVYTEIKNSVDGISGFPVSAEKPIITKVKPQSVSPMGELDGRCRLTHPKAV